MNQRKFIKVQIFTLFQQNFVKFFFFFELTEKKKTLEESIDNILTKQKKKQNKIKQEKIVLKNYI